jgi:hypothetical protein
MCGELFQNATLKQNVSSAKKYPALLKDLHLFQLPNYTDSIHISSQVCNWTHSIKLKTVQNLSSLANAK